MGRQVEGVATLGLGGADTFQFFDCNSITGSSEANDLIWVKDNGLLRFETVNFVTFECLDLSKPSEGGRLDYSDEGIYT